MDGFDAIIIILFLLEIPHRDNVCWKRETDVINMG